MNHWVVRVVLTRGGDLIPYGQDDELLNTSFLECLHRAGIARIHRDDDSGMCFDLFAPTREKNSQIWAIQTAMQIASYGFNAVAAPEMPL